MTTHGNLVVLDKIALGLARVRRRACSPDGPERRARICAAAPARVRHPRARPPRTRPMGGAAAQKCAPAAAARARAPPCWEGKQPPPHAGPAAGCGAGGSDARQAMPACCRRGGTSNSRNRWNLLSSRPQARRRPLPPRLLPVAPSPRRRSAPSGGEIKSPRPEACRGKPNVHLVPGSASGTTVD